MSEIWTPNDIDKLIGLVQNRPDLYDQRQLGYSNINTIDMLWKEIKRNFPSKTEQQLKKKWQILRTGYRTRRNDSKHCVSGSAARTSKKWVYFESLSFLEPYLSERTTSSNVPSYSGMSTETEIETQLESDTLDGIDDETLSPQTDSIMDIRLPASLSQTQSSESSITRDTPKKKETHMQWMLR
ncbi:hypothetical protein ABEB36_012776 [Hypothenemus hampei]|uniref:MADF domain-containing protein n=1 Tax=Hypothenemus hampei TaxID=57062 RepID=A0ABD1ECC9_HYPHA